MNLKKNTFGLAGLAGVFLLISGISLATFPFKAVKAIGYSQVITDRDENWLRVFLGNKDRWMLPVDLREINSNFINATIAVEDKRFWQHRGVDPAAIIRAACLNFTHQKVLSGASTISMQVIRLLEDRKRSLASKMIEASHAVWLEIFYSKKEILQLYFELAPYGGNIHGVKAASWRYFKKNPADLNLAECALLAGLPQSPSRLRPDRYPERAKIRRNRVLQAMLDNKMISFSQFQSALKEPVERIKPYLFPFKAPHFTEWIHSKYSGLTEIHTSLDSRLQDESERTLREKIDDLLSAGVHNGAVVILENKTGKVRAWVGSPDFSDKEHSGEINGVLSRRSPGSTLKPFTYAFGFDSGRYTPRMILADVPVQYDGYAPLDYSKKFKGPVSVREALIDSLNVPAVEVLYKIGYQKLYSFLKEAGLTTLSKSPEGYGLSLTLGSAEVRLLELVNAYATLARLGEYRTYEIFEKTKQKNPSSVRLVSDGASYLVTDILRDSERFSDRGIAGYSKDSVPVAWKTGTSYGHHDAWTVAYNPEYTVGVWMGNFSGKPSKALVGIEAAAPVAMKIFSEIYQRRNAPWYQKPASVGQRKVCLLSGEPVSTICPHSAEDFFITGRSMDRQCGIHKKFMIDHETGTPVDEIEKGHSVTEKVYEIWPQAIHTWFEQHDPAYVSPPIMESGFDMARNWEGGSPKILSPINRCEYYLDRSRAVEQRLVLKADGSYDTRKLFWFINGQYVNEGRAGEGFFWPMREGRHRVTVTDDYGRSSSVTISIH